jgi:uncharacterized protein YoxC
MGRLMFAVDPQVWNGLWVALIGALVALFLFLQTFFQEWRRKLDEKSKSTQLDALKQQAEKIEVKQEATAHDLKQQVEEVHKAVNGEGLTGSVQRLQKAVDQLQADSVKHVSDDHAMEARIMSRFDVHSDRLGKIEAKQDELHKAQDALTRIVMGDQGP